MQPRRRLLQHVKGACVTSDQRPSFHPFCCTQPLSSLLLCLLGYPDPNPPHTDVLFSLLSSVAGFRNPLSAKTIFQSNSFPGLVKKMGLTPPSFPNLIVKQPIETGNQRRPIIQRCLSYSPPGLVSPSAASSIISARVVGFFLDVQMYSTTAVSFPGRQRFFFSVPFHDHATWWKSAVDRHTHIVSSYHNTACISHYLLSFFFMSLLSFAIFSLPVPPYFNLELYFFRSVDALATANAFPFRLWQVFGVTFRTPPEDSTGVPHILEHSVLCGSRKYPVKEPFVDLLKGSLQTFLNAFTYPDRTCYPVASQNLKVCGTRGVDRIGRHGNVFLRSLSHSSLSVFATKLGRGSVFVE